MLKHVYNSDTHHHQDREPSIQKLCKSLGKTNISYPLIHTLTSAYQGMRNLSFSKHFAYALYG